MDRRAFLSAGGAAAVAGLTGSAARAAVRPPVFEWARPAGFFFPGELVLTPPPLAVYADDTAYAEASASLRLRDREAESLRAHAVAVLRDPRHTRRDPLLPAGRDQPRDHLRVRDEEGTWLSAELSGWGDGDPARAYPPALHELAAHVQDLRRKVLRGEPWRPNAVLLAAVRLDFEPVDATPWPVGIPIPADLELRLHGEQARAVRGKLAKRLRAYRQGPMHFTAATWRHLLPHE
ncbi:hypothetical protein [Paractinoplanes brasiliensis]|uniref:Uncharacterized protein n=1 Tax=Paractinoplanes brasiliensis TaxID=52695 RepID=A0A4R6J7M0_9ACTN|nr:hypothetical protein [Actinoplanes brasiliensis]TDO31524.1 hypothetical protein C8E87_6949 [Actinoplanes brasiliensis]GID30922.1 hypothetical protein Abr02nite_59050 [Actinoplanes brasiliensis]